MGSHQRSQHAGHSKPFAIIRERFYGISRDEVVWFLKHCSICLQSRPSNTRAPLEPIHFGSALERVQADLVDMRATPKTWWELVAGSWRES